MLMSNDVKRLRFEQDIYDDGSDEDSYRRYTNNNLLNMLMETLDNICNKKIVRNVDVTNIKSLILELKEYSLVNTSQLEDNEIRMKSMQSDMDELLITLNMTNDAELPEKYNRLLDDYKELKMQMVDMSVQLAIEVGKNADKSFEIQKLSSVNEYLTARVHLLSRKVKDMCDCDVCHKCDENNTKDSNKMFLHLKFDLSVDFEDLDFIYCVETLNQHFIHGTYISKTSDKEQTVNCVLSAINANTSEDIYIVTTLDKSIFSKLNASEELSKFKKENNVEQLDDETINKVIMDSLNTLNKNIYNKLKNMVIEDC